MSAEKPEVGDVWEGEDWGLVVVLALPLSWDEYTPSCQCIQTYSCVDENGYTRDLDITDFSKMVYVGPSKANINQLFKVK